MAAPTCTSFTYSAWSACSPSGTRTRTVLTRSPTGCTGGSPVTSGTCTPALPTTTLTASPTSIIAGASSTLTWSSTTAVSCTASGGWTGSKALSGSQAVTPTATTTYTLTCTNAAGSASQSATITVTPATTLTAALTASPTSLPAGSSSTLTATAGGTATGTINYTFYCSRNDTGTNITTPYDGKYDGVSNTTQTHTCPYPTVGTSTPKVIIERGSLAATQIQTVTVTTPAPTVSFSASPTSITTGGSSTLTWSSTNATSCTASGGWTGSKATSGSQSAAPTATTTYTLACTGAGGTTTRSVTVSVSAAAPTVSFSASPTSIVSGQSATLTWSSTNATSCTASGGWTGSKATSGTQSVTPTATTTYSLTCTGPGGTTALQSTTVTVNPPPTTAISTPATNQTIAPSVSVSFSGTATDSNGTIAGYEWRDGNCATGTLLSTASSFSTTTLTTTGTHPVYFRARDNQGAWSTNCPSRTITVQSTPPAGTCQPQAPKDPPSYSCDSATQADLTWDWAPGVSGATSYQLTVDDTSDFSSPLLTNQYVTAPTTSYVMNNQLANRMYYGRVRSVINTGTCSGTSTWSTTATLNAICPLPYNDVGLAPLSPTGSAQTNIPLTATLGGTATGTINYSAYCNRSDTGTNVTLPADGGKLDGTTSTTFNFSCNYPSAGTYTAKIIAERGTAPADTALVTVTVTPPLPTATLSASPTSIITGQSSTLTWSSTNSTSCTASGGWSGAQATSGTRSVTPTATTTYSLTCTGPGGTTALQSTTVAVSPIAMTLLANGSADAAAVYKGRNLTLSWSVNPGSATCNITATDGSTWTYSPTATSATQTFNSSLPVIYTLSCRIGTGPVQTKTVTVNQRPIPTWTEVSP